MVLPDNVSVSDFFLRMRIGRDPIASDLMKKMTTTEAQNDFSRLLDTAKVGPVTIERQGRGVAVVLSLEEYQRLQEVDKMVASSLYAGPPRAATEPSLPAMESEAKAGSPQ